MGRADDVLRMKALLREKRGPGWYFIDPEYTDEGLCGPFESEAEARGFVDPTDDTDYDFFQV